MQFRARGSKKWTKRKTVTVGGARHYFVTRLRINGSGYLRISWRNAGQTVTSRAARVTVVR